MMCMIEEYARKLANANDDEEYAFLLFTAVIDANKAGKLNSSGFVKEVMKRAKLIKGAAYKYEQGRGEREVAIIAGKELIDLGVTFGEFGYPDLAQPNHPDWALYKQVVAYRRYSRSYDSMMKAVRFQHREQNKISSRKRIAHDDLFDYSLGYEVV